MVAPLARGQAGGIPGGRTPPPPIEHRFAGPIRPVDGAPGGNPFGGLPRFSGRTRERAKNARSVIMSQWNVALTGALFAAFLLSVAAQKGYIDGPVVVHLFWKV